MPSRSQQKSPSRLGIIGGGQLALMLIEACERMKIETSALCSSRQDPAFGRATRSWVGKPQDSLEMRELLANSEVVTFENEFVDCDTLESQTATFLPTLDSLRVFQDKLGQKRLLERLKIPSAPYLPCEGDPAAFVKAAIEAFQGEVVFKWARQGYDGKGVLIFSAQKGDSRQKALDFCSSSDAAQGKTLYAEKRIDYARELAIQAVHSPQGEFACYPLVITEQENGICRKVAGPCHSPLEKEARRIAGLLARGDRRYPSLFGAFAIEFFETRRGELLVNEIAPRVHNSAHYTQDACKISQFENHVRAVLGMKLGSTELTSPCFAMVNLLGPAGLSGPLPPPQIPKAGAITLHWYGKKETRPGRKLGHLNGVCLNEKDLPVLLNQLESLDAHWKSQLGTRRE